MLFNPIVAMIHNTTANTFHPILFVESPLPGPPDASKPIRHKSKMHHTTGFVGREFAVQNAHELANHEEVKGTLASIDDPSKDIQWDGNGIPAEVAFFTMVEGKPVRAF